jgi:hypothetical protein
MSYDLQVTDADGDTVQVPGGVDVTLDPAGTVQPLSTLAVHSASAPLSTESSSSSLLATNDNSAHTGGRSQGLGNNAILFGAVAAAGLAAEPAAASVEGHGHSAITVDAQLSSAASISTDHLQMTATDDSHVQSVSVETNDAVADHQAPASNAHGSDNAQSLSLTDDAGTMANAPSELPQGTEAAHVESAPATAITAQAVMMPSAAVMAAAHNDAGGHGVDGQASTQVVGHVLADALAGGSPHGSAIDAVLANLPSHAGPVSGLEVLASNDAGSVPAWHSAGTATFAAADTVFSMETMMLHHDAVPAIHGGH